ncbi:MAG: hypothetical protein QGG75_05445, partial [Alphaproteobacteria bacterium]|nr:hypothetical protein [Alphaproteobacteria bacterium]
MKTGTQVLYHLLLSFCGCNLEKPNQTRVPAFEPVKESGGRLNIRINTPSLTLIWGSRCQGGTPFGLVVIVRLRTGWPRLRFERHCRITSYPVGHCSP